MTVVSVVIPTYNRREQLASAIHSVLLQTLPPAEILICDDGSTDWTVEMVRALGDSRVQLLSGARGGRPAIPRNRGICKSRGEWIAFLDDDDEWMPEKLETQLSIAESTGALAVCANAVRFIPGSGDSGRYLSGCSPILTFDNLLKVNNVVCSSAIIHRSIFEKVEGFPEEPELKALEDYALWLRVAAFTDFAYVDTPLLRYRDQLGSSIRSGDIDVWEQRRRIFGDFLRWGGRVEVSSHMLGKVRKRLLRDKAEKLAAAITAPVKKLKKAIFG